MNSSFLPLPPRLADPRVRRWGTDLLAALALQLPILLALQAGWPEARRPRRPARVDDTPILLGWSRPAPSATPAASLNTIPLQGLLALPPPPAALVPPPTSRQAAPATQSSSQASSQPSALSSFPPSPLPRQPGEAFLLARQVAAGGQPGEASAGLVAVQRRQWWLLPGQ